MNDDAASSQEASSQMAPKRVPANEPLPAPQQAAAEEVPNELPDNEALEVLAGVVEQIGGQRRDGQDQMVRSVFEALEDDGHLMVQAGTGTGKSFGYLVPAMVWAGESGRRVVVSTATLALQRQILTQDAPVVQEVLGRKSQHVEVAVLKGWNNYACLRKVDGGFAEEGALVSRAEGEYGATATGEEVVRARQWALESDTGDRDDLVPGVSDRAWRQISLQKRECVGEQCPFRADCFPVKAREEAEDADIVVTNHALLGIQATGVPVLPDAAAYIVDEAHDLVDRVTAQLTRTLAGSELRYLGRALRQAGLDDEDLPETATDLADALAELEEGRLTEMSVRLTDTVANIMGKAQGAAEQVSSLSPRDDDGRAEKQILRSRLSELVEICSDLLGSGEVKWISDFDGTRSLHIAPLDVAGTIADGLFEDTPAILTSATLEVGGSFDTVARQVGFALSGRESWLGIDVGSPFKPEKQAILYIASHLPAPLKAGYGDEHLEEMVKLIEASGGGALCLFTSRAGAERAADYVREQLDLPILAQGDDQLPTLLDQFAKDRAACLFGTMALWQGVDVPGDSCRLVIIDRIPFPRPNDPLVEARTELAREQGRNPFMTVSASQAALLLAQGAGRLLRTPTDRGVVAVLDSRLHTARYGGFLRASMPKMWPTTDLDTVLQALERIA